MKKILVPLLCIITMLVGCQAMGDHFSCLNQINQTVPEQTTQVYVRTETKCKQNFPYNEMICNAVPIYDTVVTNQAQRDAAMDQCKSGINNQRTQATNYSAPYQIQSTPVSPPPTPKTVTGIASQFYNCWDNLVVQTNGRTVFGEIYILYPISDYKAALLKNNTKLSDDQINTAKYFGYDDTCINKGIFASNQAGLTELQKTFQDFLNNNRASKEKYLSKNLTIAQANQQRLKNLNDFSSALKRISGTGSSNWGNQPYQIAPTAAPAQNTIVPAQKIQGASSISMDQAKAKCLDLGFKAGTESFGQCVLKIAK